MDRALLSDQYVKLKLCQDYLFLQRHAPARKLRIPLFRNDRYLFSLSSRPREFEIHLVWIGRSLLALSVAQILQNVSGLLQTKNRTIFSETDKKVRVLYEVEGCSICTTNVAISVGSRGVGYDSYIPQGGEEGGNK